MRRDDPTPEIPPAPKRRFGARLGELMLRIAVILVWGAVLFFLPLPLVTEWLPAKNAVVVALVIFFIGKTLYDTLFYEHFRP